MNTEQAPVTEGPSRRAVLRGALLAGAAAATAGPVGSLLAACGGEASGPTPIPNLFEEPEIGIAMGDSLFYEPGKPHTAENQMTTEEVGHQLDMVMALGATAIRVDFDGSLTQQQGIGKYDWSFNDNIMKEAAKRGLDVMATVAYWPTDGQVPEAQGAYNGMPNAKNFATFAKFAGLVAGRYHKLGLRKFEIWNEENTVPGGANPQAYASLFRLASQAIKNATQGEASVSLGALAATDTSNGAIAPVEFLDAVLTDLEKNGGLANCDAVAVNAYTAPAYPDQPESWDLFTQIEGPVPPSNPGAPAPRSIHDVMVTHGIGRLPVLITETGASTGGTGVEATLQNQHFNNFGTVPDSYVSIPVQEKDVAEDLTHKFDETNVTARYVYTLEDLPGKEVLDHFGLETDTGVPKKSGLVFQKIARAFARQRKNKH